MAPPSKPRLIRVHQHVPGTLDSLCGAPARVLIPCPECATLSEGMRSVHVQSARNPDIAFCGAPIPAWATRLGSGLFVPPPPGKRPMAFVSIGEAQAAIERTTEAGDVVLPEGLHHACVLNMGRFLGRRRPGYLSEVALYRGEGGGRGGTGGIDGDDD